MHPVTGTAAIAIACAILLAGCGKSTIVATGAARSVVDAVSAKTGFHPTDVRCPSGVPAKVGGRFDCHFTGPEGRAYTAAMSIRSVHGSRVVFGIDSEPTGGGLSRK